MFIKIQVSTTVSSDYNEADKAIGMDYQPIEESSMKNYSSTSHLRTRPVNKMSVLTEEFNIQVQSRKVD